MKRKTAQQVWDRVVQYAREKARQEQFADGYIAGFGLPDKSFNTLDTLLLPPVLKWEKPPTNH